MPTTRSPLIKVVGSDSNVVTDGIEKISSNRNKNGMTPSSLTYGTDLEVGNEESYPLLGKTSTQITKDEKNSKEAAVVAEIIHVLFLMGNHYSDDLSKYPKTNPKLPPEVRYKRHRNFYIYVLNEFRHWWKTSR
jgi:hypothetical protein